MIILKMILLFTLCFGFCFNIGYGNVSPIRDLTLLETTLANADRNTYAVYSSDVDTDCVWVFGGWNYPKRFYCFNINDQSLTWYYNLTYGGYTRSNGAFFIDTMLYYFNSNGGISKVDILNKQDTYIAYPGVPGGTDSCMARYPNGESNEIFYFVTPTSSSGYSYNKFYIYNTTSGVLTEGPSLSSNYSRFVPSCITHDYDSHLYVFGGSSDYKFERINLTKYHLDPDNTQWEIINSFDYDNVYCPNDNYQYYVSNSYLYTVSWKQFIFLVGNGFGSPLGDHIGMFDVNEQQLYCSRGEFSNTGKSHLSAAIGGEKGAERLYTFGGFTGGGDTNYIFMSNNLSDFTGAPTMYPTNIPTMSPSKEPSVSPTPEPSDVPSVPPTRQPTVNPTLQPTEQPSDVPTFAHSNDNDDLTYEIELSLLLLNSKYDENDISNDYVIEKELIWSILQASKDVRYEIKSSDDISIVVNEIVEYDIDTITNEASMGYEYTDGENVFANLYDNNRTNDDDNEYGISISLSLYFGTEERSDRWYDDLRFIMIEFEQNLRDYWDISNENNLQIWLLNVDLVYMDDSATTTTMPTTSEVNVVDDNNDQGENEAITNNDNAVISITDDVDGATERLQEYYNYTMIGIGIGAAVIAIAALLDARFFRHNELIKMTTMVIVTAYLLDIVSDIFFVIQVLIAQTNMMEFFIFLLSLSFILIPIFSSFLQLHAGIQTWVSDVDTKGIVQAWIQNHLRSLYAISILFASSHTAVEICNSNLFYLSVFNMGLNRRQKALFKNRRIYSSVVLENIPQLILQVAFSISTGSYSAITVFSGIFSLLSILLSLFEHISARLLLDTETVLIVKMSIKCNEISTMSLNKFQQIQNYRKQICIELSKIIDIDRRLIELLLPCQTKHGLLLTFHIRSDSKQSATVLECIHREVDNHYFGEKLASLWSSYGVNNRVKILNVETKLLKPDRDINGEKNHEAAVISLNSNWEKQASDEVYNRTNRINTDSTNPLDTLAFGQSNKHTDELSESIGGNGSRGGGGSNGAILPKADDNQLIAAYESFSNNNNNNNNNNNVYNNNHGTNFTSKYSMESHQKYNNIDNNNNEVQIRHDTSGNFDENNNNRNNTNNDNISSDEDDDNDLFDKQMMQEAFETIGGIKSKSNYSNDENNETDRHGQGEGGLPGQKSINLDQFGYNNNNDNNIGYVVEGGGALPETGGSIVGPMAKNEQEGGL